jgi:hypothetical protein
MQVETCTLTEMQSLFATFSLGDVARRDRRAFGRGLSIVKDASFRALLIGIEMRCNGALQGNVNYVGKTGTGRGFLGSI